MRCRPISQTFQPTNSSKPCFFHFTRVKRIHFSNEEINYYLSNRCRRSIGNFIIGGSYHPPCSHLLFFFTNRAPYYYYVTFLVPIQNFFDLFIDLHHPILILFIADAFTHLLLEYSFAHIDAIFNEQLKFASMTVFLQSIS